jgi:hypothetical protein
MTRSRDRVGWRYGHCYAPDAGEQPVLFLRLLFVEERTDGIAINAC